MKHITWWDSENSKNVVFAYNKYNEKLGSLRRERVGKHIHWCWYQNKGIKMSPGYLEEVRQKQKELFNNKKKEAEQNEKQI
ncbi:MAG: hypothetical protein A3K77_07550 [Euryarchaeota archaeon RBG_13_31_8]|nr:MAG: hypothetical protein A3K77_07550 [Euryarchaeota archaeon RBG_13_31_8]